MSFLLFGGLTSSSTKIPVMLTSRSTTFFSVTAKSVIKKKLGCKGNDKMSFLHFRRVDLLVNHLFFRYCKKRNKEIARLQGERQDVVPPFSVTGRYRFPGRLMSRSTTFISVTAKSVIKKKLGCKRNDKMSFFRFRLPEDTVFPEG